MVVTAMCIPKAVVQVSMDSGSLVRLSSGCALFLLQALEFN